MDNVKESEPKERFVVDDKGKANWCMQQLGKYEDQLAKLADDKDLMDAQNQQWYDRKCEEPRQKVDYFTSLLEEYRQTLPDGKLDLPAGRAKVTHSKKFIYDDDALLKYVQKTNPDYVKTEPQLKWGDFKKTLKVYGDKAIDNNGEVVPGMQVKITEHVSYKPSVINPLGGSLNE